MLKLFAARFAAFLAGCAWVASAAHADDASASKPALHRVQFVVATPLEPAATEIYCSLSTDNWPAGGRSLPRVAPGLYAAEFDLPSGPALEYKFLRLQSWAAVEKGAGGEELMNRTTTIEPLRRQVLVHSVAGWADQPGAPPPRVLVVPPRAAGAPVGSRPSAPTVSGTIRVHADFESPQLGNRRRIQVYLPPGYEAAVGRRYPVLYVHDGQNVFDASTAYTGVEWGLDEAAERLIAAGKIAPLIIVAVDNTPNRRDEYSVAVDAARGGGKGAQYLAFVCDTLKPFIDRTYRTRPEREHTGILGSSMGGLISASALLDRSSVFSRAGVVSPALFWSERAAIEQYRGVAAPPRPVRLWLDIGSAEGGELPTFSRAVQDCESLAAILRERGWTEGNDFRYELISGGRHHERDWAARADRILEYLFPPE